MSDTYHASFINMTPHSLNIYSPSGELAETIESSGMVRIPQIYGDSHLHPAGFGITDVTYAKSVVLPRPQDGMGIVVSLPTAQVLNAQGCKRDDIYVVGAPVYGEVDGQRAVIGCEGLSHVAF